MSALTTRWVSAIEYLTLDRQSEHRYELDDGELIPIEAASFAHNLIQSNLVVAIGLQLEGSLCRVLFNSLRVAAATGSNYCYPDVLVVCGEPELEDRQGDTLLNPSVIFEVLSGTTEARDRGRKFSLYRSINSVQFYVLVDQQQPHIEIYQRDADTYWKFRALDGLDAVLELPCINFTLSLARIYEGVTFASQQQSGDVR